MTYCQFMYLVGFLKPDAKVNLNSKKKDNEFQ